MSASDVDASSAKAYVARWATAGSALTEQRYAELRALTDDGARRVMLDLFARWRPSEVDEEGAELVAQQRVFRTLDRRAATP